MNTAELENHKRTAVSFLRTAFVDHNPELALARFAGTTYRQHNPEVPDGHEGFVGFVRGFIQRFPEVRMEPQRAIAEGDLVVLHSWVRTRAADAGAAVVDIFRFESGRIVEHWDVVQPVPATRANDNGMF